MLIALVLIAGAGAGPAGAGPPDQVVVTRTYQSGDLGPVPWLTGGPCGVSAACFGRSQLPYLSVRVIDDSGRAVGGVLRLASYPRAREIPFCGELPTMWIGRTSDVRVILDGPGDSRDTNWAVGPGCTEVRGEATLGATSGRVVVTYRSQW